jgi:NitT/TauT family transport system permease protein
MVALSGVARNAKLWALSAVSIAFFLTLWALASKYHVNLYVRFTTIPGPLRVLHELAGLARSSRFYLDVGISLERILLGCAIATVLGVALGTAIARNRFARAVLWPPLEILRPIPAIAWVPISIMLWPTAESSIVFITFLGAFFPILVNTIHGVASVEQTLIRAAQTLGAGRFAVLRDVMLPAALPSIFAGLAIGMGVAWVSVISAEMISGQFGIGYFTWEAYALIQYPDIIVGMIVIGILGLLCSGAIRTIAKVAMPWV